MQNKWIKIILAASLAFNLAFVSTAVYRKVFAPGQKPGKPVCKEDLKLRREQKEKIKRIIKEFRINLSDYKQDILDKRIAIIEAMSDTEFNLEDIEKKMILQALERTHGVKKRAAELLHVSFRSFRYRLEKYAMNDRDQQTAVGE